MLRENLVTASLRVDALTHFLMDLNQYNACVFWNAVFLHYTYYH